ncbi:MAG TPA: NAD-dependent epimerase [Desulfohalobiaceae bacterium]|nr:NAD-dependent epimerase [Desulfohalobiaceae bacterium]
MEYLVTGAAGFIGFHLSKYLLDQGYQVVGLDNLSPYYSVRLKEDRVSILKAYPCFEWVQISLENRDELNQLFSRHCFEYVVNLAAQAGVRYSLTHPHSYIDSNIVGFVNLLECCRHSQISHLVFASSSSVYGLNTKLPFSVHDNIDHPISLYAASKKSNELMAHCYSYLYGLPCTGLRFFTVYGPWGRPDMALFLFTRSILQEEPIEVYNYGKMRRDFTYIDDIVEGIANIIPRFPEGNKNWQGACPDPATSPGPYRVYNIGNNTSVELEYFIEVIENCLGKKAIKEYLPLQPGDVPNTFANIDDLIEDVGFRPKTSIEEGVQCFIDWFKRYYQY